MKHSAQPSTTPPPPPHPLSSRYPRHIGGVDPKHNGINPNAICKLLWQKYKLTAAKKRTSIFG